MQAAGVFDYTFKSTCHSQIDSLLFLRCLFESLCVQCKNRIFISVRAQYKISQSDDNDDNHS